MLELFEEYPLSFLCIFLLMLLVFIFLLIYLLYRLLRNPFEYPYFEHTFNVTSKRNIKIEDYIDNFLCDNRNWLTIQKHEQEIKKWKSETEQHIKECAMPKRRNRQYHEVLDDKCAYRFKTVRYQTRYRQRNYIKTSYKVAVVDSAWGVSWNWLARRHKQLESIGFEATLNKYHSDSQRKLMTYALRKQIMERDHYTCQNCGKYMPDEVGLQIDHIIPIAKGGKSVPSNLCVLCSKCNGSKGAK